MLILVDLEWKTSAVSYPFTKDLGLPKTLLLAFSLVSAVSNIVTLYVCFEYAFIYHLAIPRGSKRIVSRCSVFLSFTISRKEQTMYDKFRFSFHIDILKANM